MTLLFSDIEGSTKLWEEHPEAMRAALARHDALMRGAIEGAGGALNINAYFAQIDALSETVDEKGEEILGALYEYAEAIAPEH